MNVFFFVLEHRYPGGGPTQCDKRHSIKEERGRHDENASVSEREGKLRVDSVYLYYILYKTSNNYDVYGKSSDVNLFDPVGHGLSQCVKIS